MSLLTDTNVSDITRIPLEKHQIQGLYQTETEIQNLTHSQIKLKFTLRKNCYRLKLH